jgi:hypothetical protein
MILRRSSVYLLILGSAITLLAADSLAPAFSFRQVEYFHRWSGPNQHEYTPAKQEDLEHWTDMITINGYPNVDEAEKMAGTANAVLGNYRSHKGKILRTNSLPATDDRPAEHFISVLFGRPEFSEAAFARFKLVEGKAHSFVYSHRFYGGKAPEQMSEWLKSNGEKIEKALMDWNPPASATSPR